MRKRRSFTDEFKAESVALVLDQGMSLAKAARDLDLVPSVLRGWVEQAKVDRGVTKTGLTSAEKEELQQLRREVRELRMEREILKNPRGPRRPTWSTRNSRCAIVTSLGG